MPSVDDVSTCINAIKSSEIMFTVKKIEFDETLILDAWHKLRPLPKAVFYFSLWDGMNAAEIVELFKQERGKKVSIDRIRRAYWDAWRTVLRALEAAQWSTSNAHTVTDPAGPAQRLPHDIRIRT